MTLDTCSTVNKFVDAIHADRKRNQIKLDAYQFRKKHSILWKRLRNSRKMALYHMLVAKDTAEIYQELLDAGNYMPLKFREKEVEGESENMKRQNELIEQYRLKKEVSALLEKGAKEESIVTKCDKDISDLIATESDIEIRAKLNEIWLDEVAYEEEKSRIIWGPKKERLANIEEIEKKKQEKRKEERRAKPRYADVARMNTQQGGGRQTQPPPPPPQTHRESTPQPQRPEQRPRSMPRYQERERNENYDNYDNEWQIPRYNRGRGQWRGHFRGRGRGRGPRGYQRKRGYSNRGSFPHDFLG